MAVLDDALALAAKGWPVFPTGGPEGKTPLAGTHGFHDATTDETRIREMFASPKAKHVGIGLPDGTWAIDVDHPENLLVDLPLLQQTPSGGFHAVPYRGNGVAQDRFSWGDTRVGGKGYLVAWQPERWPSITELVEPSADVLAIIRRADRQNRLAFEEVDAWSEGERNAGLTAYAGSLRAAGATYNEAKAAIKVANRERCTPPLPEREVNMILGSLSSWERGEVLQPATIKMRSRGSDPAANPLVTVNARDLLAKPPPRPIEVVPGLVPAGLSLLAAKPKIGKSWLTYQASVAIATGGELLARPSAKGDVLYLALEDGEYRAWSRITSILGRALGAGSGMPDDAAELEVAFLAERGDPMVEQVEEWLSRHPAAKFVAVDTLQKVRPSSNGRRGQYEMDAEDAGRVLGITKRHPGVALLVVHHDRKERGDDFLEAVSGTHGISGSVDTVLLLRRGRHETTGTLEVTGRDVRESLIYVRYDEDQPYWMVDPLGGLSEGQLAAFEHIRDFGPIGVTAIGQALGITKQAAYEVAERLVELGAVRKQKGIYSVVMKVRKS